MRNNEQNNENGPDTDTHTHTHIFGCHYFCAPTNDFRRTLLLPNPSAPTRSVSECHRHYSAESSRIQMRR